MKTPLLRLLCAACLALVGPAGVWAAALAVYEAPPLPSSLHPFELSSSVAGLHLSVLLVERPARLDVDSNQLVMPLFEPWPQAASRVVELQISPGVVWSDGAPFTAADVVASYDRLRAWAARVDASPSVKALARCFFLLKGVEQVAERTLRLSFSAPVRGAELPALLAPLPLIPAGASDEALSQPGAPTLGPYVVASLRPDYIELVANRRYFLGAPHIGRVEVYAADEGTLRVALATPGSGEISLYLPADVELSPDLSLRLADTRQVIYLGFNRRPGSLFHGQPGLREVVAALVDRATVLDTLPPSSRRGLEVASGPYSHHGLLSAAARPRSADLVEAESALEGLGYARVGDSWRDGRDQPLTLRLRVHPSVPSGQELAAALAEQIGRIGVVVDSRVMDRDSFNVNLERPGGDFDLILHEWLLDESEDLTELYSSRGALNYLGYAQGQVDQVLALERKAQLASSRRLYRREIEDLLLADPPALFLWQRTRHVVVRSDVTGVPPLDPYYVLRDVHLWKIEDVVDEDPPEVKALPSPTPVAGSAAPAADPPPTPGPTPD